MGAVTAKISFNFDLALIVTFLPCMTDKHCGFFDISFQLIFMCAKQGYLISKEMFYEFFYIVLIDYFLYI